MQCSKTELAFNVGLKLNIIEIKPWDVVYQYTLTTEHIK